MADTLNVFGTEYSNVAGIIATTPNDTDLTYIRPQGTKSITQNGTGIDVASYASVDVSVSGAAPTIQSLTVTPSTSQQTFNASGVDGYKPVTVSAMPSGTAGTPTATKGTVSNHSISVTPSVTNSTGYITGSTKTGTAVTVSVSELESGTKSITENGTGISVSGYSSVNVAVSGGSASIDTKTVTASNYPVSISFSSMKGEPKAFFLKSTSQISSSGSTSYYYVICMRYNGTNTTGNCFRIGSTRRVDPIISGYSWSYSGTTLTITSSASSRSYSPGAFNNTYELVYIY